MNLKVVLSVVVAAAALFAQGANAADAPKKAEGLKAGEGMPTEAAGAKSNKSRADVKAETKAANKNKQLAPAGDAPAAAATGKSDKSRAAVKAETKEANKKRELTPAGDAPAAPKK